MKVSIRNNIVILDDDKGNDIHITTDQLLEMLRILDITFRDNGSTVFDTLEFTV